MKFIKPPTTFVQQIQILQNRGLIIPDHGLVQHYLSHLNYYRLGAYWLPFEKDHGTHEFDANTNFGDVLDLYVFDRELRLLVMDAIERFEVSVRTQWAYWLSHSYGSHAYLDTRIFKNYRSYTRCISKLREEIARSHETFIIHYKTKYTDPPDPPDPPIWAVVEVMSLGQLPVWCSNIKKRRDRKQIANTYGIDEKIIMSFLHHLAVIRNICAHHGRLWNRRFTFTMMLPTSRPSSLSSSFNRRRPRKLYNTLVMLEYLMEQISPGSHWKYRLIQLFQTHPSANSIAMGFPEDWQSLPIWQ